MIISASRRTDIPAFYSNWFVNRIRAGYLLTRNPFNSHQISRVSLHPDEVEAIVFWTRDPRKLMPHLEEIGRLGHRYCFLFTITGYPRILEKCVPHPNDAVKAFVELSTRIGPDKIVWRYDPVLLANVLPVDEHKRIFSKIAALLAGHTSRVIISFAEMYRKVKTNLGRLEKQDVMIEDINQDHAKMLDLSRFFAETARNHGMEIQTCAEEINIEAQGIKRGKCIDDGWLNNIFSLELPPAKDKGQREACGCIKSIDIGTYDTCLHGCEYCYATSSHVRAKNNYVKHDPLSPFLLGPADDVPECLLQEKKILQPRLF